VAASANAASGDSEAEIRTYKEEVAAKAARKRRLALGPTSPRHAFLSLSILPLAYVTAHTHRSLPLTSNGTVRESLRA
jgi:hypothetical protein